MLRQKCTQPYTLLLQNAVLLLPQAQPFSQFYAMIQSCNLPRLTQKNVTCIYLLH